MKKYIIFILILQLFLFSCKKNNSDNSTELNEDKNMSQDSILAIENAKKYDRFPLVEYEKVVIRDRNHALSIINQFDEDSADNTKNRVFCLLNRKARYFIKTGDTVVVPKIFNSELIAYSIFPQYYHGAKDIKKLIVVSNKYQSYAAYENGIQVHFAACNTGKERTPTYPGRYSLVWKKREHRSSLDSDWVMPYTWNFHQYAGCAFHQFTMPGYAASHSCVRQFKEDALWLFKWGEKAALKGSKYVHLSGTPIIVIDVFDYSRPRTGPWIALNSNKELVLNLPENPMEVEEAYIPICQIPVGSRGRLHDYKRFRYAEDTLRKRGIIREGVQLIVSVNFNKRKRDEEKRKLLESQKTKNNNGVDELNKIDPDTKNGLYLDTLNR